MFLLLSEDLDISPRLLELAADFCDTMPREGASYLCANAENRAEIYAPEIAVFLARSRSDDATKAKILEAIYECRAARLDLSSGQKIDYDPKICQYHEKSGDCCALCAAACEEKAIVKDEASMRLKYAADLCVECGKCAGVCPTGAIEFGSMPREAIAAIAKICEGFTPLLIEEKSLAAFDREIPAGFIPIAIPNAAMFGKNALLTLVQECGSQIVFFGEGDRGDQEDQGDLNGAARFINDLFTAIYAKPAIVPIEKIEEAQLIAPFKFSADFSAANERAALAARMKNMVGGGDFGVVESDRFGVISIDGEKCTLCAACAENCVTGALAADEKEGILWANDSLCTLCGGCAAICPEKAIALLPSGAALKRSWFERREAARDTEFYCVECGKPFASSRAIAKVTAFMSPLFLGDSDKLRTLACCSDCKPKVMIKSMLGAGK